MEQAVFLRIDEHIYDVNDLNTILRLIVGKTVTTNKGTEYFNVPFAFDIETTSFYEEDEKRAIMYGWTFGVNGYVILGRTWEEFLDLLDKLRSILRLNNRRRIIIYVHNLAFEFQFMRKYFNWSKVFSLRDRSPLYAISGGFEFRCSYLLSGYNLANLGKNLAKYKVEKMEGDLDYSLKRHSQTPLTEKEKLYMVHDVLVVMAYIQERIDVDGDITRIPLTKTGYVRNHCRQACLYVPGARNTKESKRQYFRYRDLMNHLTILPEEYYQLKRAFQGGFTHASSWKVDRRLSNVGSFDFKSSYPAVMVAEKFPMSKSEMIPNITLDVFEHSLLLYCCMFDVEFINIREKLYYEHPISVSRCRQRVGVVEDNGRLVEAEHIITTMTEQDYFTAREFYEWDDMIIHNFRRYERNYLPTPFVECILQMYKDKTELDGIDPVNYARSKTMINAAFGMIVTDIVRDEITYNNDGWGKEEPDLEEAIEKYNRSKNRFLYYPWGVWVTAYARRNLFTGIREFGNDYVYSDTDSIKAINYNRHHEYIARYNQTIVDKLDRAIIYHGLDPDMSRPYTPKGEQKQLGIWDFEGEFEYFKTLGAKRYMVCKDGKINITISGVNKKAAVPYLVSKYKTIDTIFEHFTDGLEFPPGHAGKNTHTYLDEPIKGKLVDYLGQETTYEELSSVHLEEAGYSMGLAAQYIEFLRGVQTYLD